jgi:hypothetical protein
VNRISCHALATRNLKSLTLGADCETKHPNYHVPSLICCDRVCSGRLNVAEVGQAAHSIIITRSNRAMDGGSSDLLMMDELIKLAMREEKRIY